MFEYFQLGGPIMYVLLICSIVAVGVFIERLIYLTKTKREINSLSDELQQMDYTNIQLIEEKLRENPDNMLSRILQVIVDRINQPTESVKESVVRKANSEIPNLEKNITALGVIYNIAPMLGLLGTVLGLTITLQDLVSDPERLLTGIYVSLITTIAGLIIAIPTHIAHSYLTSKVNKLVLNLENKTSYFVEELKR
jgi:biopolymer transport protein ExbB